MFNLFKSEQAKTISKAPAEESFCFENKFVRLERIAFCRRLSLNVTMSDILRVRAAKSTSKAEVLKFIKSHESWIASRLKKNSTLRLKYPPKKYSQGESFLFFGSHFHLHFEDAGGAAGQIFLRDETLVIGVPGLKNRSFRAADSHPELAQPIRNFYRHQGRNFIEIKTSEFAKKMQLFPRDLSFRSQKTRWGSCSANGHLSFNWRLIVAPREVIEYVIVHELAHLKHHDHSKNFWLLVASQIPNYRILRKWLKDNQFEADFLAKQSELWSNVSQDLG